MHAVVFVTRSESDVRRSGSSPDSPQTPSSSGSR
jgi:hypothetical protein